MGIKVSKKRGGERLIKVGGGDRPPVPPHKSALVLHDVFKMIYKIICSQGRRDTFKLSVFYTVPESSHIANF